MVESVIEHPQTTVGTNSPPADTVPPTHQYQTIIEPVSGWQLLNIRELWQYRELLFFFTWRDVKLRYKQTLLGAAWALIQPLMMMVVFTIFLGRMAKVDSGSLPYPVFVYAGLLPWTFFSTAISNAGNSVVNANQIITKIYFPRLIVPFASVGAAVVDFLIAFSMLVALMVYYGIQPNWTIVFVPLLLVLGVFAALGVGTLLAALNVAYRDFKYTIPFLVQLWMFATPTVYMNVEAPSPEAQTAEAQTQVTRAEETERVDEAQSTRAEAAIPSGLKALLHLNPMTGVIAFFRAATLGGALPWQSLAYSVLTIVALFVGGLLYFRRVEARFADII